MIERTCWVCGDLNETAGETCCRACERLGARLTAEDPIGTAKLRARELQEESPGFGSLLAFSLLATAVYVGGPAREWVRESV